MVSIDRCPTGCVSGGGAEGRLAVKTEKTYSQTNAKKCGDSHHPLHAVLGAGCWISQTPLNIVSRSSCGADMETFMHSRICATSANELKGLDLARSTRRADCLNEGCLIFIARGVRHGLEKSPTSFLILIYCFDLHLTGCVTRGWARGGNATLPEPARSHENAKKRGDSHPSGARIVSPLLICIGTDALE